MRRRRRTLVDRLAELVARRDPLNPPPLNVMAACYPIPDQRLN